MLTMRPSLLVGTLSQRLNVECQLRAHGLPCQGGGEVGEGFDDCLPWVELFDETGESGEENSPVLVGRTIRGSRIVCCTGSLGFVSFTRWRECSTTPTGWYVQPPPS
jgi:hypothetical protein